MEPNGQVLPPWVSDPALIGLWQRVRDRLERTGLDPTGRVKVALRTRDERHAVSALLGRSVTRDAVVVDLGELDRRLRERSGHGGLVDVLTTSFGGALRDRRSERLARDARREEPMELARLLLADRPWVDAWVADLRRTGLLTRASDPPATVREAVAVLAHLGGDRPAGSRVELAARVLGDAHALDEDRLLHRVVLRALAAAAGVPVPETSGGRWTLWESAGVTPDGVSSTCLTLGLRASRDGPTGWRLDTAGAAGDPVHLTRWDLQRLSGALTASGAVLVCENPRVLEAVAESYAGSVPVVCTSGEPNAVVAAVLDGLLAQGVPLRYHGDFDWAGISIANRVIARFGARPWRMSAAEYLDHVRAEAPELIGEPVEPSWDPELGAAMRANGRCLHEETVLPVLLEKLG